MKLRTNLLIAFIIIGLTISLSSVAFAQSSKKKSKTPPAKASGAKAKTAGLSQGTFSQDVAQKNTNLSGLDDPDGNTQRSSKASNSKAKTTGYAEYEEIADQTPKKPANNGAKANKSTKKTNSKSVGSNGIEMTPCDVQGKSGKIEDCNKVNEEKTQRSSNATDNKSTPKQNAGFMDYTDDTAVKSSKNTKKTTDFQTTSEDLQSLKATKKTTNLSGVDDPEVNTNRSSKAPKTTNTKTKNAEFATFPSDVAQKPASNTNVRKAKTKAKPTVHTNSRKPKTNGVYEEDEQKTPKKKP